MSALLMVPVVGAAGLAFDYTDMLTIKGRVSNSLDAAAFEAAKLYMKNQPESVIADRAEKVFVADLGQFVGQGGYTFSYDGVAVDDGSKVVKVAASVEYNPTFMPVLWNLLGQKGESLSVARQSEVSLSTSTVEVALVLDNSGSMAGSKLSSLQDAASGLVDDLFDSAATGSDPDAVEMSIVPFAASVNVGAGNRDATWMDTKGVARYHHENFDWSTLSGAHKNEVDGSWERNGVKLTRFWLYDQMGVDWDGCVEARPYPYNVDNTSPDPDNADTLFVPMLAPDEPDSWGLYTNNYLNDGFSGYSNASPRERQENVRKYLNLYRPPQSSGPNEACTSEPLLPMTANETRIKQKIKDLRADGNTDVPQGAAWGLHTLTPGSPFDGPRDFGAKGNIKAMVVMTDGANTYTMLGSRFFPNINGSTYAAYGYADASHAYDGTTGARSIPQAMDQHLLQVCSTAKAQGVMVFTIAFDVNDGSSIKKMLRECASDDTGGGKLYFDVENNGTDLENAFGAIGSKISALRLYR